MHPATTEHCCGAEMPVARNSAQTVPSRLGIEIRKTTAYANISCPLRRTGITSPHRGHEGARLLMPCPQHSHLSSSTAISTPPVHVLDGLFSADIGAGSVVFPLHGGRAEFDAGALLQRDAVPLCVDRPKHRLSHRSSHRARRGNDTGAQKQTQSAGLFLAVAASPARMGAPPFRPFACLAPCACADPVRGIRSVIQPGSNYLGTPPHTGRRSTRGAHRSHATFRARHS
jgi:hypothetical protein